MGIHREAIDRIYKLAKRFKGLVPGGISQVGEIPNPKKNKVCSGQGSSE